MNVIPLSTIDLLSAAFLVVILSVLSSRFQLAIGKRMIWAAMRMTAQLLLIGLILKQLFQQFNLPLIALMASVMVLIAGREVIVRQRRPLSGVYGYGVGVFSMFLSSFTISFFALTVIIQVDPWYTPQYSIPLLGMLLGNTMTGIALALDRLTTDMYEQRNSVEQRLYLGETWYDASADIRQGAMRTGMIPIINAMAAAGVVSLPGTMTGQILGGSPPLEAVKYQILLLFLIAAGTGFGSSVPFGSPIKNSLMEGTGFVWKNLVGTERVERAGPKKCMRANEKPLEKQRA